MFFRRTATAPHDPAAEPVATPAPDDVTPVLDALGQLMASYTLGCFDMPRRPREEVRVLLDAWRRHALLGIPVDMDDSKSEAEGASIAQRDWRGVTATFAEHRRSERAFVEQALGDLRDAVWMCIERTQLTLEVDAVADQSATVQMTKLRTALDHLDTGAVKDEIAQALRALESITAQRQLSQRELAAQLASRVEHLGAQLAEVRRQSETDALTGLGNRHMFERAVARHAHLRSLGGQPVSLVILDLDYLKPINDSLGHHVGDQALKTVGKCLHKVFTGETDVVCRIGGDEFAVLLPNTPQAVADRMLARFESVLAEEPWPHRDDALPLEVSMAAVEWLPGDAVASWVQRADAAMYAVKQQRRR